MAKLLLCVTAVATLALPLHRAAAHEPYIANGEVARVSDGDTLFIDTGDDEWLEVRLYGVDCPETEWPNRWTAQARSTEAKDFAIGLVAGKEVSVRLKDELTYGRAVGEVFVDGKSLSRELLRSGLAWWNKKYEKWDYDLKRLEEEAKSNQLGIWADPDPTPPWEHRKANQ